MIPINEDFIRKVIENVDGKEVAKDILMILLRDCKIRSKVYEILGYLMGSECIKRLDNKLKILEEKLREKGIEIECD